MASPYSNLLQLLLDVLRDHAGDPPKSFAALLEVWRLRLRQTIRQEARCQNLLQMERERLGGDPLVSCFVNDCLSRGHDIDQGGARHNWIMPSFVGLANLADSLEAIRPVVYEQGLLRLDQLCAILEEDFTNQEPLRQMLLHRLPKYGNDLDAVDDLVCTLTEWMTEETVACRTWRGDRLIPSLFCWIMHEQLGSRTGASPDGRVSGFPLGDGSGPAQGREKQGPTASILSSTKWSHEPFIGGIAVNLKFSRNTFGEQAMPKLLALIRTFMARGGGYSDYFVRLSPAMQEEVLLRSEHAL